MNIDMNTVFQFISVLSVMLLIVFALLIYKVRKNIHEN